MENQEKLGKEILEKINSCQSCSGCAVKNGGECNQCGCGACCGKTKEYDLYNSVVVATFDPEDLDK